ncbi:MULTISPECIES: SHOCT domain-containing protein [Halorussus]|uniref:SHOCT domain-containing protein n=1 Tax=Halorussus TaxID=1070314 RepID=UPI00209C9633|nr:SHOCT domain-containing protein [Halorussus vallis]USZ74377.1 SHOCT domain-containing protein [Halorussus vallis]
MAATPGERLRENATKVASTLVTGLWLVAMFTGQDWWLAALFVGYFVVVPIVALLFGDEDDISEWWDDGDDADWGGAWTGEESEDESEPAEPNNRDALETLRERYARGELTDEQFERKLERLLDTETLESVEDRAKRERERLRE